MKLSIKLKILVSVLLSVFLLNSKIYAAENPNSNMAERSRAEAKEAAKQAKTATEDAVDAADLAFKITAKEEFTKFGEDLQAAAERANQAAKNAEAKASYAYKKSLDANKAFATNLVLDAKEATAKTGVALEKVEAFLKRDLKSGDNSIKSVEADLKKAFEDSAVSTKKAANTASTYFESVISTANSDLKYAVASTKEFTSDEKRKIESGYDRQAKEIDVQITKLKEQLKTKSLAVRTALKEQVSDLENRRAEIKAKLDQLGRADASAWADVKRGVDIAFKDIKVSFHKAKMDFKRE